MACLYNKYAKDKKKSPYWIVEVKTGGIKRNISLGSKYSKDDAEIVRYFLTELEKSEETGRSPSKSLQGWLDELPPKLRGKLEKAELIEPSKVVTNLELWDKFTDNPNGRKDSTMKGFNAIMNRFLGFFAPEGNPRNITKADGLAFKEWLEKDQGYATATVATTLNKTATVFNDAIEKGYMEANPFKKIPRGSQVNKSKHRVIPMEDYRKLLKACGRDNHSAEDQQEMRAFLALLRIGALRSPSETLLLKWSDVLWSDDYWKILCPSFSGRGSLLVHSPKTERHGKGMRRMPLFPLLRLELENLYKMRSAEDRKPDSYILQKWRGSSAYLGKQIRKIQLLAGVEIGPDPQKNFRRTRSSEISQKWGPQYESDWVGHSPRIALEHYGQQLPEIINEALNEHLDDINDYIDSEVIRPLVVD